MLHMFHTYVASVFIWMLRMFAMVFKCFQVFFFKCFRCKFQVLHLSSDVCFKSRSDVAHVVMVPVAGRQWSGAGLRLLPSRAPRPLLSSPLLSLPSLPFSSLHLDAAIRARLARWRGRPTSVMPAEVMARRARGGGGPGRGREAHAR
jgi:hypothetical protein